jgi:RES domain-containing protein
MRARLELRLRPLTIDTAHRIIWRWHQSNLLRPGPRKSRFSDGTFAVLYAASSFETALLETVVRDQFVRVENRVISSQHILQRLVATLRTQPHTQLTLLDLRDSGIVELGAPTDALRARNHQAGQALGREIYRHSDVDGLVYPSRFNGNSNFAIFDRAVEKLDVVETGELAVDPALPDALARWQISIFED